MYTKGMGNNNDRVITLHVPTLTEVFCPQVGWTVARDGFCHDCGSTDHETAQDMADNAPLPGSTYRDGWED